jgi:hypothetical protein
MGLITSRMGSIDDNGSGGYYGYRLSKVALNMAGCMVGFAGIPPEQAAVGLLARLDALSLERSGRFWHANVEELPW